MLETIGLTKVYKPKKGKPVTALSDVSIRFPDRGMVFLLGKSGSGKSTLLNLLGGLDKYNEGDIVLDGVSTKKFSQSDFDSYRNACMGFIFQEYNVLNDFTVGVNIALAIELQGRRAEDEEIDRILQEVDLSGYGRRRPNELSGGQLQRVAIARALVKNPKIILADEPTGALDSATGRQIFELLKKLSGDKLVIIVSHDREYSEQYADRIIELADGKIISDVTKQPVEQVEVHGKPMFEDSVCKVSAGYHLTEEDREEINRYLQDHPGESLCIRVDDNLTRGFVFANTKEQPKDSDESLFEKIRSKLPMSRAARIGIRSLGCKKLKLFFTILISVVAFGLFGTAATLADYDYTRSVSKVFRENEVSTVYVQKQRYYHYYDFTGGESDIGNWDDSYTPASTEELSGLQLQTGITLFPVYHMPDQNIVLIEEDNSDILAAMYTDLREQSDYMEIDETILKQFGATVLVGELPDGSRDEIAISKVTYEMIFNGSLLNGKKIPKMSDMIGTTVTMQNGRELTISGIIDTGLNYMDYFSKITELAGDMLAEGGRATISMKMIKAMVLVKDLEYDLMCNLASKNLVGKGFVERQPESVLTYTELSMMQIDPVKKTMTSAMANMYSFFYGDINDIDRFDHVTFAGKASVSNSGSESDNAPTLLSCYLSRGQAENLLYTVMSANNRKYFGIDEAVSACYRASIGASETEENPEGDAAEPQEGDEGDVIDDTDPGVTVHEEDKDEREYFSKNEGDGEKFVLPDKLTRKERDELSAYLGFLNDKSFADLFEKVCGETDFTFQIINSDRNYIDENTGKNVRNYFTLDVLGIVFPPHSTQSHYSKEDVFFADIELLKKTGITNLGRIGAAMVFLPEDRVDLEDFIRYSHLGENDVRFHIFTKYNVELDAADIAMNYIKKGLIAVGVFFAVFAALLLTSFIVSSITYKKHDIGILRAIGSRGSDVFRIFGSESMVIALICFVITTILTGLLTGLANRYILMTIHVSILEFGIWQVLLILVISVGTALIASFLPVMRFARKRPIDAIRGR